MTMALQPLLKAKVDELFLLWLSERETQEILRTNLSQLLRGEPVTRPASQLIAGRVSAGNASINRQAKSPRIHSLSSSPGPPSGPNNGMSPRSPRPKNIASKGRPLPLVFAAPQSASGKDTSLTTPAAAVDVNEANSNSLAASRVIASGSIHTQVVVPGRGEPDGQSASLLRNKDKELQKKQERDGTTANKITGIASDGGSTTSAAGTGDRQGQLPVSLSDVHSPADATFVVSSSNSIPVTATQSESAFTSTKTSVSVTTVSAQNSVTVADVHTRTNTSAPTAGARSSSKTASSQAATPSAIDMPGQVLEKSTVPIIAGLAANIPQFYFPNGNPTVVKSTDQGDAVLRKVKEEFEKLESGKASISQMGPIVKALGLPFYWKCPVFNYAGGEKAGHVTVQAIQTAWKRLNSGCFDDAAKFSRLLAKPNRTHIEFEDFLPFVQDVVDTHPGLIFLQDAPEFHSRYVQTVISRIFYTINRSWSGRITAAEIRKSNFLQTVRRLEEEDDINQITDFFSYEHFYVIYCKFWELDKDHDLYISKDDLGRHSDHAISTRIIDRIFSGAVTRNLVNGKLSYRDFVWFLISEEDKRNPRSIEYWFRCMDLDGDGIISMFEMEYFYEEQVEKMEMLGIETLPFQDCLCQMLDMVKPREAGKIRLRDLKACKLTPVFFDTFINLDKYLEHEQKDPFANLRDQDSDEPEPSDWERYAAEEYEVLVAEEGAADNRQEDVMYEDDFEPDNESTSPSSATNGPSRIT